MIGIQLYSYSFAPNPNWLSRYASQPEILSYIEHVAAKHGVAEYIRPNQECLGATWRDRKSIWDVQFRNTETSTIYAIQCRILIASVGSLDIPRGPDDIAGIQDFREEVFHSSSWDHGVDFSGKNVVVVGNGCSANQFIPWLVENAKVASLTQVVRSAHWIAPKVDREIGQREKWYVRVINNINPKSDTHQYYPAGF
jgi:cation diffusion facilitator CzcD-associated flavoprotein CzcO